MARAYYNGREIVEVERYKADLYSFYFKDTGEIGKAFACQIQLEYDEEEQ